MDTGGRKGGEGKEIDKGGKKAGERKRIDGRGMKDWQSVLCIINIYFNINLFVN